MEAEPVTVDTFPITPENSYTLQTSDGPVVVFSRRNLSRAMADAMSAARRSTVTATTKQK